MPSAAQDPEIGVSLGESSCWCHLLERRWVVRKVWSHRPHVEKATWRLQNSQVDTRFISPFGCSVSFTIVLQHTDLVFSARN